MSRINGLFGLFICINSPYHDPKISNEIVECQKLSEYSKYLTIRPGKALYHFKSPVSRNARNFYSLIFVVKSEVFIYDTMIRLRHRLHF